MQLRATIGFWSDGIGCFCHEAVFRAMCDTFGDVELGRTDLAHEKYNRVADEPKLKQSAWFEYLRNGPAYAFTLPSGIAGRFSRYTIEFSIGEETEMTEVERIREFLNRLKFGIIEIEED